MMVVGNPAGAAKAVAAAAQATGSAVKVFSKDTIELLKSSVEVSISLLDSTTKIPATTDSLKTNPSTEPPILTEAESAMGSSGMDNIVVLAAWDKWALESDQQMEFAVGEGIKGSSEYRLELEKHAVDGKLVTQARGQAIKAGQEYAQLQLGLHAANRDFQRLQTLRIAYDGEISKADDARARFYDSLMMIRTSVLVELRKAVWAYKYLSLRESSLFLDPLKSIADLRADAQLITHEVENWQEQFSSDFSPYTPAPVMASELSAEYGRALVASLQKRGFAVFTLTPTTASGASASAISGPFTDGSHFRVEGMRAYLIGARIKTPAADGSGSVTLTISTSGLYSDIQNGQVLSFAMIPLSRQFKYRMEGGSNGNTGTSVLIDAFIANKDHVDPTPFTQWTLTIKQPEQLDLSSLTDVKLQWQGRASFQA